MEQWMPRSLVLSPRTSPHARPHPRPLRHSRRLLHHPPPASLTRSTPKGRKRRSKKSCSSGTEEGQGEEESNKNNHKPSTSRKRPGSEMRWGIQIMCLLFHPVGQAHPPTYSSSLTPRRRRSSASVMGNSFEVSACSISFCMR